jgi:hypothetical protein
MTCPIATSEPGPTPRLDPLIEDARRHARRRRAWSGALVLASLALAAGLFFLMHPGGGGAFGPSGIPGAAGEAGSNPSRVVPRRVPWFHLAPVPGFFGLRRPPGGAELRHQHELLVGSTAFGKVAIWAAPSYGAPARCTWLKVGRAVYGGMCRLYQPPGRGLLDVVPLRLVINGRILNLLWGQVGTAVSTLTVRFQNGSEVRLPLSRRRDALELRARQRVFLYPIPRSHWATGRRPALLIARDTRGRTVGKPVLFRYLPWPGLRLRQAARMGSRVPILLPPSR